MSTPWTTEDKEDRSLQWKLAVHRKAFLHGQRGPELLGRDWQNLAYFSSVWNEGLELVLLS